MEAPRNCQDARPAWSLIARLQWDPLGILCVLGCIPCRAGYWVRWVQLECNGEHYPLVVGCWLPGSLLWPGTLGLPISLALTTPRALALEAVTPVPAVLAPLHTSQCARMPGCSSRLSQHLIAAHQRDRRRDTGRLVCAMGKAMGQIAARPGGPATRRALPMFCLAGRGLGTCLGSQCHAQKLENSRCNAIGT